MTRSVNSIIGNPPAGRNGYNVGMSNEEPSSRREFFSGKSALNAADALINAGQEDANARPPAPPAETYLMQVARRAMATDFQVFLNAGQYPTGVDTAIEALDLLEPLEQIMTVYRDSSDLNRLNQNAGGEAQSVPYDLIQVLELAADLSAKSGGAFDITTAPLIKTWGFFRREGKFPDADSIQQSLQLVDYQAIEVQREELTVSFSNPDLELNLGGIGKGYALDQCADRLVDDEVNDFLIHGGQSSILAKGDRHLDPKHKNGWTVTLNHPLRERVAVAEVYLKNRALGTSGSAKQFFHHEGKRYGHVLDPRTGYPAEGVLSATVLAPTAAEADALSTAFYVMGPDAVEAFCEEHSQYSAILVCPAKRAGGTVTVTINLPDDQFYLKS